MSASKIEIPNCPENCTAAHTINVAMFFLGISRTRLYELMADGTITFVETDYGRRIRHNVIENYLSNRSNKLTQADTGEQLRKMNS